MFTVALHLPPSPPPTTTFHRLTKTAPSRGGHQQPPVQLASNSPELAGSQERASSLPNSWAPTIRLGLGGRRTKPRKRTATRKAAPYAVSILRQLGAVTTPAPTPRKDRGLAIDTPSTTHASSAPSSSPNPPGLLLRLPPPRSSSPPLTRTHTLRHHTHSPPPPPFPDLLPPTPWAPAAHPAGPHHGPLHLGSPPESAHLAVDDDAAVVAAHGAEFDVWRVVRVLAGSLDAGGLAGAGGHVAVLGQPAQEAEHAGSTADGEDEAESGQRHGCGGGGGGGL